jgi:hypothetical protein
MEQGSRNGNCRARQVCLQGCKSWSRNIERCLPNVGAKIAATRQKYERSDLAGFLALFVAKNLFEGLQLRLPLLNHFRRAGGGSLTTVMMKPA